MGIDLTTLQPFEICSIKPPTENFSLTFRLTRNCYWNKCAFCPVYKFGARFSRRELEEVQADIEKARVLYDLLKERNIIGKVSYENAYERLQQLLLEIWTKNPSSRPIPQANTHEQDLDPRLEWFLSWFKEKPDIKDSLEHLLTWSFSGGDTCFLGDADSLILKPHFLNPVLAAAKKSFPTLKRFTIYGRTRSAARSRKLDELTAYHQAGLHRVHFGLESGSDKVLKLINKGETREDHIVGGLKTKESGLSVSFYVMPGLGGQELTEENAIQTADVINQVSPDFVRLRSLQIFPQTPLEQAQKDGQFIEADESQIVAEIRNLLDSINISTRFYSDSAINLVSVDGKLPEDKPAMLQKLDDYLRKTKREQLEYSLNARLGAFMGQYGGLTEDIYSLLTPFIKDQSLDTGAMSDSVLADSIRLIKSKLMP